MRKTKTGKLIDNRKKVWTTEELSQIYELRKQNKSWRDIGEIIKTKTSKSLERKYGRMNWKEFWKDPKKNILKMSKENIHRHICKKWIDDEMVQLDAFLQAGKSYDFIAEKLNRSFASVESKAQSTDWKAWKEIRKIDPDTASQETVQNKKDELIEQYVMALLHICHSNFDEIDKIKLNYFVNKVNLDADRLFIPFADLKEKAKQRLVKFGMGNPETIDLKEGTYVIVGDSHGKHTKANMFKLLKQINAVIKPKNIIHIGHILDDDSDISYDWGEFKNLIIIAREEELKIIQDQRNKFKFSYDIVRGWINIGELVITNQEMISDFVKTSISTLDMGEKAIVSCHRLELTSKCSNSESSYYASPGCLCDRHIPKTMKQIDFQDGKIVKEAYYEGFSKYRRMGYMNKYWEKGLIVVQVDKDLNHTVVTCPIKNTVDGNTTSYFDKIISAKGVFNPDKKIFVIGDLHCDKHDTKVLDVEEQICKDYKADACVNIGDTLNYSCLNHHEMDRGVVITDKKILDESANTHYVLARIAKWAKENYIILGNHERFAKDFIDKYPQFDKYLEASFLCGLDDLGYKIISLKGVLRLGTTTFIHGELKMYGQSGSKIEKTAKTFGKEDIFMGHIHRPEIRMGCYSVGLSGNLDQDYNEKEASNWIHGFGLCNQYKGQSWLASVAIVLNRCVINNKTYSPRNVNTWELPKYKAKIVYEFEN